MQVKRDQKFEYGGNTEAGASTGARAATSLPRFTRKELEAGLGPQVSRQIEDLFKGLLSRRNQRI